MIVLQKNSLIYSVANNNVKDNELLLGHILLFLNVSKEVLKTIFMATFQNATTFFSDTAYTYIKVIHKLPH